MPNSISHIGNEIGLLNRLQRGVLFGGAAVMSVIILVVVGLAIYAKVSGYISNARVVHSAQKSQLLLEIDQAGGYAARSHTCGDAMEHRTTPFRENCTRARLRAPGGRIYLQANPKVLPQLAMGDVASKPAKMCSDYLAFSEGQAYTVSASSRQRGREFTGYHYTPDEKYITFLPPPKSGDPVAVCMPNPWQISFIAWQSILAI